MPPLGADMGRATKAPIPIHKKYNNIHQPAIDEGSFILFSFRNAVVADRMSLLMI